MSMVPTFGMHTQGQLQQRSALNTTRAIGTLICSQNLRTQTHKRFWYRAKPSKGFKANAPADDTGKQVNWMLERSILLDSKFPCIIRVKTFLTCQIKFQTLVSYLSRAANLRPWVLCECSAAHEMPSSSSRRSNRWQALQVPMNTMADRTLTSSRLESRWKR